MKQGFTGRKELDKIILNNLSDEELRVACQTDSSIKRLCDDDSFWALRLQSKYPEVKTSKPYSWKDLYFNYLIGEKYGDYLGSIGSIHRNKPKLVTPEQYYYWLNKFYPILDSSIDTYVFDKVISLVDGYPALEMMTYYRELPRWDMSHIQYLMNADEYIDVNTSTITDLLDTKKDGYIFIPSLRVAGTPDGIRAAFNMYPVESINEHINNAIKYPPSLGNVIVPDTLPSLKEIEEALERDTLIQNKINEIMVLVNNANNEIGNDNEFIRRLRDLL